MHLCSISLCSVLRFNTQPDILIGNVEDLPCLPGFNNSMDGGDCRWWSPHDGLATKYKPNIFGTFLKRYIINGECDNCTHHAVVRYVLVNNFQSALDCTGVCLKTVIRTTTK